MTAKSTILFSTYKTKKKKNYVFQELQQAADFLEIPFLSKAITTSIQQPSVQNEHLRSYLLVYSNIGSIQIT